MAEKQTREEYRRAREIAAMYKGGATLREVGDHYGIHYTRVREILLTVTGIKPRPRGGYYPRKGPSLVGG